MAEKGAKANNNNATIIIIAIVAIVAVVAIVFAVVNNNSNKTKTAEDQNIATQQQQDSNDKLGQIQGKIDAQQKVIDDLNKELTPLIEKRTSFEEQLIQVTTPEAETTGNTQE